MGELSDPKIEESRPDLLGKLTDDQMKKMWPRLMASGDVVWYRRASILEYFAPLWPVAVVFLLLWAVFCLITI